MFKKKSIDQYITTDSFLINVRRNVYHVLAPVKFSAAPLLINKGFSLHSLFCNLLHAVNCGAIIKVTN